MKSLVSNWDRLSQQDNSSIPKHSFQPSLFIALSSHTSHKMSNSIPIRCLCYGDSPQRSFKVLVKESDDVADIKKLIKIEMDSEYDMAAHSLELYQVDIEIQKGDTSPQKPDLNNVFQLDTTDRVGDWLPREPLLNHIYLIIKRPATGM